MKRVVVTFLLVLLAAAMLAFAAVALLLYSNAGARWAFGQAQQTVGGELRVERIEGSLAGGLRLAGLHYSDASADLRVVAAEVTVRPGLFPPTLNVRRLALDGVRYRILDDDRPAGPTELPGSLVLPMRIVVERLSLTGLLIEDADGQAVFVADRLQGRLSAFERLDIAQARLDGPLGRLETRGSFGLAPPWRLDLAVEGDLRLPPDDTPEPLRVRFGVSVAGQLDAYRVVASGDLSGEPVGPDHRFELAASGALDGLEVDTLSLDGPRARLETGAALNWVERRIGLSGMRLTVPGSEFEASADLQAELDTGRVAGDVRWSGFAWPLGDERPRLRSPSGAARLEGTLDDWTIEGHAGLWTEQAPPADLRFTATGDREGLQARIDEGAVLGGVFAGQVTYAWTGAQAVTARLTFSDIETQPLAPGWPGRFSGEFAVDGALEPLDVDLTFERLDGTLRALPVTARGGVGVTAGWTIVFDRFEVAAGGSRATLNGALDAADGLAFDLQVTDPGALLPGAGGRAVARGRVALVDETPRIELELQGESLTWRDVRVESLDLRNVPGSDRSRLRLEVGGLAWNGQMLDALTADLDWNVQAQGLVLEAVRGAYAMTARAAGQLVRPETPQTAWRWNGNVSGLVLKKDDEALLGLEQPAPLAFDPAQAAVRGACLETTGTEARFCLDASWEQAAGASGALQLDHFPLDLAAQRLGAGIEATQAASGRAEFSAPPGGAVAVFAEFALSPGVVRYLDDPDVALETAAGRIRFDLADGMLKSGRVELPMPGQGGVELDLDLARVADGPDSPLSGKLRVALADLDVLSLLIPAVDRMSGRLDAVFDLTGTAGDPGLEGRIDLVDGAVSNFSSGLELSDIQLSGAVSPDRQTRLSGRFRAIEGEGRLDGALDLTDLYEPRVSLDIEGENLLLFDAPTLRLAANPDLQLQWRRGEVGIAGRLAIPRALFAPELIPTQSVGESEDAVIVAGQVPQRQAPASSSSIAIRGDLEVALGPDVRVKLPIAELGVSGTTRFSWEGGPVPLGDGAFDLSGEILALGQLLEISEGKVSFPHVRADNPHLNIRTEREIFGNSEIRTAGVLIAGTLRRPLIEPYTEPMTNRERARTLLITGSDFDMERGVGSVDVGTYIAPKIFISYGIGVFNRQSVFSVRYDLGRGLGIKATSGEDQTGVDVSYTVEK